MKTQITIMLGFPGTSNNFKRLNVMRIICKIFYIVYTRKLAGNNTIDFFNNLSYLKHKLEIENLIYTI